MKALYKKYTLNFKIPGGTSRGILTEKETWVIIITASGKTGIGECSPIRGLSIDDPIHYEQKLAWVCHHIELGKSALWEMMNAFPSIQFGIEQAFMSLKSNTPFLLFPSAFTLGKASIPINGLIWMGDESYMKQQIAKKLKEGFSCIKLKIGAIDFDTEHQILKAIRHEFSPADLEIRVDANGAFHPDEAVDKIEQMARLSIHSIEQPIAAGQWDVMARLCETSPIPVALDEELIGISCSEEKENMLGAIHPEYIILKPSLTGGYKGTESWIATADKYCVKWWITSALESNIGLNAIAQWTFTLQNKMYQGLGTGNVFTNNFASPLTVKDGNLHYLHHKEWLFNSID